MVGAKKMSDAEYRASQDKELAFWVPQQESDETAVRHRVGRAREYQRQLLNLFRISGLSGITVDVGCGPVPALEQIEGNFVGLGLDPLIPDYVGWHRVFGWKRTALMACRAEQMGILLPTASVHNVISINALDYCQVPEIAFVEIARILRPGGTFYLSFCIENASYNSQAGRALDLTTEDVRGWAKDLFAIEHSERIEYGPLRQPAALMILSRAPEMHAPAARGRDGIW